MRRVKFTLSNDTVTFAPHYFPDNIRVTKERELTRSKGICMGEDVADNGSKNREIRIKGRIRGDEKDIFNMVLDSDEVFMMSSNAWSGRVRISDGEYEGPTGIDGRSRRLLWNYRLNVVRVNPKVKDSDSGEEILGPSIGAATAGAAVTPIQDIIDTE